MHPTWTHICIIYVSSYYSSRTQSHSSSPTAKLMFDSFSLSLLYESSLVAWVDDEPASLVSYCRTHPFRGWGIVDERRTGTTASVARYQTPGRLSTGGTTWLSTRNTNCCGYTGRVVCCSFLLCFGFLPVSLFLFLVLRLTAMFIRRGVSFCGARSCYY